MSEHISTSQNSSNSPHLDGDRYQHLPTGISPPLGVTMIEQGNLPDGASSQRMKDLIEGLAMALVDSPDSVSVEVLPEAACTVLRLRVAVSDIGKVIGKQGRTARSIRTILSAASMKLQHRFSLDIVEVSPPAGDQQQA
jgi:predicted RNA-binding protein YlqC (UPF0109 family)